MVKEVNLGKTEDRKRQKVKRKRYMKYCMERDGAGGTKGYYIQIRINI